MIYGVCYETGCEICLKLLKITLVLLGAELSSCCLLFIPCFKTQNLSFAIMQYKEQSKIIWVKEIMGFKLVFLGINIITFTVQIKWHTLVPTIFRVR